MDIQFHFQNVYIHCIASRTLPWKVIFNSKWEGKLRSQLKRGLEGPNQNLSWEEFGDFWDKTLTNVNNSLVKFVKHFFLQVFHSPGTDHNKDLQITVRI